MNDLIATVSALGPAAIVAQARAIELTRTPELEAKLLRHHGFGRSDVVITPFMLHACALGAAGGCFAFDRLERHFPPPPATWLGPEHAGLDFTVRLERDHVVAPKYWPFAQEAAVADFELTTSPKWLGHGLLHCLCGFAWWPGITEWEVLHMARLAEAVAAWWWYWPAELGREHCGRHTVYSGDWTPPDCLICRGHEAAMAASRTRLERVDSEGALAQSRAGLAFLLQEVTAYATGLGQHELLVGQQGGLTVGEACDYARVNTRRLRSPAFARWAEHLCEPGVDYDRDLEGYAARAQRVIVSLLGVPPPEPAPAAARAVRVVQDVGWRLCHAAALAGDDARHDDTLIVLGDAVRALRSGADWAATLTAALTVVAAALARTPPPAAAQPLLALGYDPGVGPAALTEARRTAYQTRVRASGSLARHLLTAIPAAGDAVLCGRDRTADVMRDLVLAARPALMPAAAELVDWLRAVAAAGGPDDTARTMESLWYYRIGRASLPGPDEGQDFFVRVNPYLSVVESPYDPAWLDALLSGQAALEPVPATAPAYVMVGPGRQRPLLVVATPERLDVLSRLESPRRIADLLGDGVPREALSRVLDDQLVLITFGGG